jgi:hypothetical protein
MLKKIAFCGLLIAGFIGPALAQTQPAPKPSPAAPKPSPSPSPAAPKPGTRANTLAAIQAARKTRAAYDDQCNTGTSLDAMNAAYSADGKAWAGLDTALRDELETTDAFVMAKKDATDSKYRDYFRLKKSQKDIVAEIKAKEAWDKAVEEFVEVSLNARENLARTLHASDVYKNLQAPCPKHQKLIDAKKWADEMARLNSVLHPQKTATGEAKKADDCNRGTGATGSLEKLACQEGK